MRASQAMKREVLTIPPELSLKGAWAAMKRHHFRHFPVVASGKLQGILSDRDILLRASLENGEVVVPNINVAEAMTRDPICCAPEVTVDVLAQLMIDKKIDALPIVDRASNKLVGLVTSTDLMALLIHKRGARAGIPFTYEMKAIDTHGLQGAA
jgi:CBS domain-containing membrane protein